MSNYKNIYYKVRLKKSDTEAKYINRLYKKYKKYIDKGHEEFSQAYPEGQTAHMTPKQYFKHTLKLTKLEKPKKDLQMQASMAIRKIASEDLEQERINKTMKEYLKKQLKEMGISPRMRNRKGQFVSPYSPEAEDWYFEDINGKRVKVHKRPYPDREDNWYEIEVEE